jgi:uncharacterized protein
VLSSADRQRLETRLADYERATTAQMVIAVFPSLEGESLEDVSIRLAEKWKVGKKGADNGLILLVFLKERRLRIEVGYGLEPVIPDAVAAAIVRDTIAPRFRERRYAAGLEAAVDEVFARIGGGGSPPHAAARPRAVTGDDALLLFVLIFGGVAALTIFAFVQAMQRARRGYTVDRRGWRSGGPTVWGGGGWGGGWSGGGFSGGGGGFGGGGASGDW